MTFDLETWFKVTAHRLPKGTLWVKYEPDWAKEREDMPRTRDLGRTDGRTAGRTDRRTDGRTDGQTDHYRAPAKRGPNN